MARFRCRCGRINSDSRIFGKFKYCPVCGTARENQTPIEAMGMTETENEVDAFILTAKRLGIDPEGKTRKQIQDEILAFPSKAGAEASQVAVKEVYREREVITREIVKIRCGHCGTLFEEKLDRCPHCGASP